MTKKRIPGNDPPSPGDVERNSINDIISQQLGCSLDELTKSWDNKKAFINRFTSLSERAKLCSLFYNLARTNKHLTPLTLFKIAADKLKAAGSPLWPYLNVFKQDAINFADYVLEREALPKKVRLAINQYQSTKYRDEHIATKAPTQKQVSMLKYLGFKGSIQNRLDASEMISKLKGSENEPETENTRNS